MLSEAHNSWGGREVVRPPPPALISRTACVVLPFAYKSMAVCNCLLLLDMSVRERVSLPWVVMRSRDFWSDVMKVSHNSNVECRSDDN